MADTWHLRPLSAGDQAVLWDLLYEAIYVPPGHDPPPRSILLWPSVAHYALGWGRAGDRGIGAVDDASGAVIGAAWLRRLVGPDRGYGWVDDAIPELSIAVLPSWRGRGIGTALLVALLEHHRGPVSLSVTTGNPAQRLYGRHGFRVVASGSDTLTMLREAR